MPDSIKYTSPDEGHCVTERRQGCADLSPRNRRADLRMGDINRIVENRTTQHKELFVNVPGPGELTERKELYNLTSKPETDMPDKNTPSSLKQLRWEIYDLIERYEGDYGRTISMTLRSEIEDLFKKYTDS